jgi:hypothetical protein
VLREYTRADGTLFVHRELVAAVQMLRTGLGKPVKIMSQEPGGGLGTNKKGLFIWLQSDRLEDLAKVAKGLVKDGDLASAAIVGDLLYIEMHDPANLPALNPDLALDRAILVTAGFETSGDPNQQVTENFDGAGLSFGPMQVNFGTGTLQELFKRFQMADERALKRCFGDLYDEWAGVLRMSRSKQIAWADARSTGAGKSDFSQPWKGCLQAVGREPRFRRETLGYAYDSYGRKLVVALNWLGGLAPIKIDHFRCLSALYDLCVQQGSLNKAHTAIRKRFEREQPQDQFALVRMAVEERGRSASTRWRADCISRRLSILQREPYRVSESGQTSQRDNRMFYLLRNSAVKNVEKYLL